jgi:hypothetical protein
LGLCPKTEEYLDWKTIDVVKTLVEDTKTEEPKVYTMDSWFDFSEVKTYLEAKKQYYILSANTGRNQLNIYKVLPKAISYQILGNIIETKKQTKWHRFFQMKAFIAVSPNAYIPINLLNQNLEKCPLSQRYKTHFSTLDLFDPRFYKIQFPHKRTMVSHLLVNEMLHIILINSLVIYNNQPNVETLSLRRYMEQVSDSFYFVIKLCYRSLWDNKRHYAFNCVRKVCPNEILQCSYMNFPM